MLYLFYGDRYNAREYSRSFIDACKKKRPSAEYIFLSSLSTEQSPEELLSGQGLFEKQYIVFCDEIFEKPTSLHIKENIKNYVESKHMFVIFEPVIQTTEIKKLEKDGAKIKYFKPKDVVDGRNKIFSLSESLLKNKKEMTFKLYHNLLKENESPISILNIIFWQLRMINLVATSSSATAANVKPFVYSKSKTLLEKIKDPFGLFVKAEKIIRKGRLMGMQDEELVEYLILSI